jgi:hypothetical protein
MKSPSPREAARRSANLMKRGPCRTCHSSEWLVNDYGDQTCIPCARERAAEHAASVRRRMR